MNTRTPASVPAGWYHDPEGSGHPRWWDGGSWTDHLLEQASPESAAFGTAGVASATDRTNTAGPRSGGIGEEPEPQPILGLAALTPGALAAAMERLELGGGPSPSGEPGRPESRRRLRWIRTTAHTHRS